ncbi:Hypothetical predicted protein [Olea europaea subsp. europaea]|uniref:Uncharacterized protein n=1 Tax=Olea europaea subsp. europaea TaxID=158383 RepID=A0A8S0QMW9_OLEEU|nr:Hypothetical predicted protein [Olea europaea subsp. europaea]
MERSYGGKGISVVLWSVDLQAAVLRSAEQASSETDGRNRSQKKGQGRLVADSLDCVTVERRVTVT